MSKPDDGTVQIKHITDPRELRALSHPLRSRLLAELYARGHGSVSQLAAAVGEPINKVSFHLRQLAKYDFLEEAPDLARDGRDRWWRPTHPEGVDIDPALYDLASSTPASSLNFAEFRRAFGHVSDYMRAHEDDGLGFCHDWYLRMSADELAAFDRDYIELCMRWRERTWRRAPEEDLERGRTTYVVYALGIEASTPQVKLEAH